MDQAITIGMVFWASLAVIAVIAGAAFCFWVLSVIADGFKH